MRKLNNLSGLLNAELGLLLSISLGLFLFVLFFQPFTLDRFDFNNRLIFFAGLGVIIFIIMVLSRVIIPWFYKNYSDTELPAYLGGLMILVLNSVAFAFYLRYVGHVGITFFVMVKVVLISFGASLSLGLTDSFSNLKHQNELLILERKEVQKQVERYEEDYLNKSIDFYSENITEKLSLLIADVAFIRSADNYVEIVFREGDNLRKQLLRNTLKNIELQIKPYSNFLRCHRICIVNQHYIEKLESDYSNHWLVIKGYNEHIPVSRQYLLKLKEVV